MDSGIINECFGVFYKKNLAWSLYGSLCVLYYHDDVALFTIRNPPVPIKTEVYELSDSIQIHHCFLFLNQIHTYHTCHQCVLNNVQFLHVGVRACNPYMLYPLLIYSERPESHFVSFLMNRLIVWRLFSTFGFVWRLLHSTAEYSLRIFYVPTFQELICTNYLLDFRPDYMQIFYTESSAS